MKTKLGDKEKLRKKIIERSAKVIKKDGIEGAGVDKIMKSLGLTTGALYSHFKSKDDLIGHVVERQVEVLIGYLRQSLEKDPDRGLSNWIDIYLSEEHIKSVSSGCAVSALLSDISRASDSVKSRYTAKLEDFFEILKDALPKNHPDREAAARSVFLLMTGAVNIARSYKNAQKIKLISSQARKTAHLLVNQARS